LNVAGEESPEGKLLPTFAVVRRMEELAVARPGEQGAAGIDRYGEDASAERSDGLPIGPEGGASEGQEQEEAHDEE
jgi:hypothetical protein